jgi:hypothetical protein
LERREIPPRLHELLQHPVPLDRSQVRLGEEIADCVRGWRNGFQDLNLIVQLVRAAYLSWEFRYSYTQVAKKENISLSQNLIAAAKPNPVKEGAIGASEVANDPTLACVKDLRMFAAHPMIVELDFAAFQPAYPQPVLRFPGLSGQFFQAPQNYFSLEHRRNSFYHEDPGMLLGGKHLQYFRDKWIFRESSSRGLGNHVA